MPDHDKRRQLGTLLDEACRKRDCLSRALLPVAVQRVELLRQLTAALCILGHEQFERQPGVGNAPGSVQPRPQPIADVVRSDCGRVDTRALHECAQPRPMGAGDGWQTGAHDAAVLVGKRRHVANRAQRGNVEIRVLVEWPAGRLV